MADLPKDFLRRLRAVTATRPKRVIDHVLNHGHVTTEELKNLYGYNHPPRAARDVRELGIPLETFKVTGRDGRSIAAYRFPKTAAARGPAHSGRRNFPKAFKNELIRRYGSMCAVCSGSFPSSMLQIDHRVPYEVGGQAAGELVPADYMLVCRTCNRAKSWTCEHCPNWLGPKDSDVCRACFWGNPPEHTHIATVNVRRLDLVWTGRETDDYDRLRNLAKAAGTDLPEYVKSALRQKGLGKR